MAIYTNSSELDHTNLQKWDIVIIGWHRGTVAHNYISFDESPLWHKETCETFHDIHHLAYAIYQDVSTISSIQQFPTFTNTTDATAIVQELMHQYNVVEPHPDVPRFATETGPVYAGQVCSSQVSWGSPKTWSVTGSGSVIGSEPDYIISGIDIAKKKSRIVFSKIR